MPMIELRKGVNKMHVDICFDTRDPHPEGKSITPAQLAKALKDFEDSLGGEEGLVDFEFEVTPADDAADVIAARLELEQSSVAPAPDVGGEQMWDPSPPTDATDR